VRLDDEIQEPLADHFLGSDLDHEVAAASLDHREFERHRDARAIEPDAVDILGGGKLDEEPFGFALSALKHRNFGVQRLIELGIDMDRAETERKGVRPAQRKRDRQRQLKRSFHLDKPPNRRLKPAWGPFPRPAKLE